MNLECRYYLAILLILLATLGSCNKEPQVGIEQSTTFIKFFGGSDNDHPTDLINFNDGYAISGTINTNQKAYQACVICTDKYGNENGLPVLIGNQYNDIANKIFAIDGGDLIMVGTAATDANMTNTDLLVSKISSSGIEIWTKTFGGTGKEEGLFGMQSSTGNILVGGYTESSGHGGKDIYLIKLDADGKEIWSTPATLGSTGDDVGYDMAEVDGNFVVAGSTTSFNAKNTDLFLINVDNETGKPLGYSLFGDSIDETGLRLMKLAGNDLLILGQAKDKSIESNRILVLRTNISSGDKWSKTIPVSSGYETAGNFYINNNLIYIFGTFVNGQGSDFLIHTLDLNGNLQSTKIIPLDGDQIGVAGLLDSNGIQCITGSSTISGYKQVSFFKGIK